MTVKSLWNSLHHVLLGHLPGASKAAPGGRVGALLFAENVAAIIGDYLRGTKPGVWVLLHKRINDV